MKKTLIKFFAICFAITIFAPITLAEKSPKMGGTLVFGRGEDAITLDPAKISDTESWKVAANIFEGLVRYKDDSGAIEPALASSWKTLEENTQWIFHLRKDVLFHDGTPLTADAVVFSIMRQLDPTHTYHQKNCHYAGFMYEYIQTVTALDAHTVKITLERPYAPFLANLAMIPSAIVNPVTVKKMNGDIEKTAVGTGPFIFKEWVPGDRIIIKKNNTYWDRPAFLDQVIFKIIRNNKSRLLALNTSAIHAMDGLDPNILKKIIKSDQLTLDMKPGLNVGYMAMNMDKKPFDQLKVRLAVNHAVNKKNLVKFFFQDLGIPAKNPIPPTLWSHNDDIIDYEYNPKKAKQLLREAGFENGFKTKLWYPPKPNIYMPQPPEIARAIKANLAAVGIKVTLATWPWKEYLKKVFNGEHEMVLFGWVGDNGDPDNFLYVLLDKDNAVKPNSSNFAFFKNDRSHDLLVRAQQIMNKEKRSVLYRNAQKIIHENAPWVPLVHAKSILAFQKTIHAIEQVLIEIRFKNAWID
ncbi:ABC transporter substrate-binding protein [Desulfobacula toluolica]|uniref:GsiB2: glutathione-binding protein n=1 Tax=Desulfobacula toluolica (strain DSM 7467 / Tol2) TaxID=651182 RepID=K0NDZ9_DESTT|nr:ABC transporter substrate-binding protein [Desulfobacula toluolica]CCK79176.1 GsiB2: glutathione-binding protein, precursor [Desulfobacula toluolica Tol2]